MKARTPKKARSWTSRGLFFVLLGISCAQADPPPRPPIGTAPRSIIPADQPALGKTWPPPKDEQVPPGTEKIVLFTREPVGKTGEWDFIAGAWEFIPSRPAQGVVKRAEFAHSSWSADPLLDDCHRDLLPFVRLQVDKRPGDYTVNVYRIDYTTWDISVLAESKPAPFTGLGAGADNIYVDSSDGMLVMNRYTGRIDTPSVPCKVLEQVSKTAWLVRRTDGDHGALLFDPSTNRFGSQFDLTESDHERNRCYLLSPSRRFLVSVLDPVENATGFPREEDTPVKIYDLITGEVHEYKVRTFIKNGRGVRFILPYFTCWFSGPDELRFQSGLPDRFRKPAGVAVTESTFELKTGSRTERKVDRLREDKSAQPPRYRPSYLTAIDDVTDEDQDLAAAFLKYKGIKWKRERDWSKARVAYNTKGTRFFLRILSGNLEGSFFLGDLEKGDLLEIPVPRDLKDDNAMNIIWVRN